MIHLEKIEKKLSHLIFQNGEPWAKLILLSSADDTAKSIKLQTRQHPNIRKIIHALNDPEIGIPSLDENPADFRTTNSYFWLLRFLSDLGFTAQELNIEPLLDRLLLNQTETCQFQLRYNVQKQKSIELTCMTAHLLDCLANLGYGNSNAELAGIEFLVATQRKDGSWHCEQNYQQGEKLEAAPGCPAATVYAIRALAHFPHLTEHSLARAVAFLEFYWQKPYFQCPWTGASALNLSKLRYPPHFSGLDLLNIFDTLSLVANFVDREMLLEMAERISTKSGAAGLLVCDKRIPFWRDFDFAHNKKESSWLTAIFVRSLRRILASQKQ